MPSQQVSVNIKRDGHALIDLLCSLRLLLLVGVMSRRGRTCTPPALPGLPVPPAAAPTALAAWARLTAGTYQVTKPQLLKEVPDCVSPLLHTHRPPLHQCVINVGVDL